MAKQFHFQLQFTQQTAMERERLTQYLMDAAAGGGAIHADPAEDDTNIDIMVEDADAYWASVQSRIRQHSDITAMLITTCEGEHGWDDYLLLHHFDPHQKLDTMAKGGAK